MIPSCPQSVNIKSIILIAGKGIFSRSKLNLGTPLPTKLNLAIIDVPKVQLGTS